MDAVTGGESRGTAYKIPESVLVVIHTRDLLVLMMERAKWPGFWQSVTGSLDYENEPLRAAAIREVREETGIDAKQHLLIDWQVSHYFDIFRRHQSRYAPGVTRNLEHVFSLQLSAPVEIALAAEEHLRYQWLPWQEAADLTLSSTNRDAILQLPQRRVA